MYVCMYVRNFQSAVTNNLSATKLVGWLVFNSIATLMGYLMPNLDYIYSPNPSAQAGATQGQFLSRD